MVFMKLANLRIILFLFTILLFVACKSASGQTASDKPIIITTKDYGRGEVTLAEIDNMVAYAQQNNERLFVVARLGSGEKSHQINQARLAGVRRELVNRKFELPPVYAEGERVQGQGRVEFYVGSRLYMIVLAGRNKIPPFNCC